MSIKLIANDTVLRGYLIEFLQTRIEKHYRTLSKTESDIEIRRLQGKIQELEQLKKIKEIADGMA